VACLHDVCLSARLHSTGTVYSQYTSTVIRYSTFMNKEGFVHTNEGNRNRFPIERASRITVIKSQSCGHVKSKFIHSNNAYSDNLRNVMLGKK
jgi:hypothetical protein